MTKDTTTRDAPGERGASLLELLMGTVLSVVLLVALVSVVVHHSRLRSLDDELNLAYLAARNTLEELRSVPFSSLPGYDGTGFDVPAADGTPGGLRPVPGDADGLPGLLTVTLDKSVAGKNLYLVHATVTWRGVQNRHTFDVLTLIGERN